MIDANQSLDIAALHGGYRAGQFTPRQVLDLIMERSAASPERHVWIAPPSRERLYAYADALAHQDIDALPLYGIPFAIKDNIDLAGVPTTAGCAEYAYVPKHSASVVQQLIDAGAIPLGKTNLDQFATGLVGTRSPYGACRNSFDPDYVAGGSSSGSAVAVAIGLASFALGTDTAGSGRVPAALNNLIGLKPSLGLLSTRGVVPACRTLDCVSVFALNCSDAAAVLRAADAFDPSDPYARPADWERGVAPLPASFRFGVPRAAQLEFFGDAAAARLFDAAVRKLEALGGEAIEIDFTPFLDTARLLYEGPWVAERYAAIKEFFDAHSEAVHPVTRRIIGGGVRTTAVEAFTGYYRLQTLKRSAAVVWNDIDVLLTPTAGTVYRIDEVEADPIRLNSNLGYYTNFMNLLDLSALAVPAGFNPDGLPFGVTLCAPVFSEPALLDIGDRLHRLMDVGQGATGHALPAPRPLPLFAAEPRVEIVVCGAHLSGLPLNHQLVERGGRLLQATKTAPTYRLYALPGGPPYRPGLVRGDRGGAVDVEVWDLPVSRFGSFVAGIPAPLGIGHVELADGRWVQGFVCEAYGVAHAEDITALGGWRHYLQRVGT